MRKQHHEVNHCHWCDKKIGWLQRLLQINVHFDRCPNCQKVYLFHRKHGAGGFMASLSAFQPRCFGKYVGHPTGHVVDHRNPVVCPRCTLVAPLWTKWYCDSNPVWVPNAQKRNEEYLTSLNLTAN